MTYWQVREVCEVGKEGRLFKLHKDEPLTVGRNNDRKLQLNVSFHCIMMCIVQNNDNHNIIVLVYQSLLILDLKMWWSIKF